MGIIVVQYRSKEYRGNKAGEYTCGSIVVNYLGACNGMIFNSCPCDGFNASIGKYGYSVTVRPILHLWNAKLGIMQE